MKYCNNCGNQMVDEAVVCVKCGCKAPQSPWDTAPTQAQLQAKKRNPDDAPSFTYALIGFLIPIAGLVLYLYDQDKAPRRAKSAGKGAIFGLITSTVIGIISSVLFSLLPLLLY